MFRIFTRAAPIRSRETIEQRHENNESEAEEKRLVMLKWHIERYDRLRTSTAGRAAVVLSAGAILSAGNALVLGQMLSTTRAGAASSWWSAILTVASLASAGLVVLSVLKAANVLVTTRRSRDAFKEVGRAPVSLIFNGTDTLANVRTFAEFHAILAGGSAAETRASAEAELWVCIHQHRHRYAQLRAAVRLLRHAAVAFFAVLVLALSANLAHVVST
jgi:hypothetical protein